MSKLLFVTPNKKGNTDVIWSVGSDLFQFNSKIEYIDAIILLDSKKVAVFHTDFSNESNFVGRIFDFYGNVLFDIPYPDLGWRNSHVHSAYSWSSESKSGITIIFKTDSINYRDFCCDFDFVKSTYLSLNEAR